MTKFQLMLTSLVAVIPGVVLVFLLVMAMLSYSENMSMMAYVVIGATLLSAAVVVLIPAGVMMEGKRKGAVPATVKQKAGDDAESMDDDISVAELSEVGGESAVIEASEFELDDDLTEPAGLIDESEIDTEPVEEFESGEFETLGDDDAMEFEELDEEPKPKKKKR